MLVGLKRISTALGLLAATAASTFAQNTVPSTNQATADAVAGSLRSSKSLSRYRIEVETQDGVVTLTGVVSNRAQKTEAVARAQQVAGVASVVDQLGVAGDRRVRPVQYQTAMGGHRSHGNAAGDVIYEGAGTPMAPAQPVQSGPIPEGPAGAPGMVQGAIEGGAYGGAMVPNAAAPGYPTTHPWGAWANVSPAAPYPEIPLGWERVTLRWDDGIWWLDFKKNYTRPFFTPWPFQIWAY